MKYGLFLFTLTACGVLAANANVEDTAGVVETKKSSEEKIHAQNNTPIHYDQPTLTYTSPPPAVESEPQRSVIPTIILPNNVCVINTDLSPDRTIEDHILACVRAQQIRRSIQR